MKRSIILTTIFSVIAVIAATLFFWPLSKQFPIPKDTPLVSESILSSFKISYHEGGGELPLSVTAKIALTGGSIKTFDVIDDEPTTKTKTFTVSAAELSYLYKLLQDNQYKTIKTRSEETYDRGGETLRVTEGDQVVEIANAGQDFVVEEDLERFKKITTILKQYISSKAGPVGWPYE